MLAYRSAHAKQFLRIFLGMKRAAAKIVPKLLNFEQKQRCIDVAEEMLTKKKNITGDESWKSGYDIETKAQSSQ